VESTDNRYWLGDGLVDEGCRVHPANPSAVEQHEGLKTGRWQEEFLTACTPLATRDPSLPVMSTPRGSDREEISSVSGFTRSVTAPPMS